MDSRERTLIDECLGGRTDAFGELVRPYQDRLFNTLYRLSGSREDAAELLQDALIRSYHHLASFQGASSFYTWLHRVALNLALTRRRKRRLRVFSTEGLANGSAGNVAAPQERTAPARNLEQADRRRVVEEALASVAEPFRVVLILKEMEGLKYEEIAKILNLPVGTVRSRLHRARKDMRDRLQPLFDQGIL